MSDSISRRDVLKGASVATGLAVLGGVWAEPLEAQKRPKGKSPNSKLNIACVGCGGQGASDINHVSGENIVALCDVDEKRAASTFNQYSQAQKFQDYREMFDKMHKEIDAVVVSTPDHNHAVITSLALKMNKHVYCQKPLTHNVYEARYITNLAKSKPKLATQMGTQGHAFEGYHRLVEIIQKGVIGEVSEVHIWTDRPIWPQGVNRPTQILLPPSTLNWDQWIGPAAMRLYNPAYLPFVWRGWWDFGTGALGDMACHLMDPAFWALELGAPSSVTVVSTEGATVDSPPTSSVLRYEFPKKGKKGKTALVWYDGKNRPPTALFGGETVPKIDNGSLFIGSSGKLLIDHNGMPILLPKAQFANASLPAPYLKRSPGHYVQWIEACKTGSPTGSHFRYAGPMTEAILLGNVALQVNRRIEWDAAKMVCKKDDEATALIKPEYRDGWVLS
jgi:predicted dehydrogenase